MDRGSPSPSSYSESTDTESSLLDTLNCSERTRNVLKSVMKSRKSWKSLKDGEVVWSLELEAALLEGLEKYVPQDTRETRILGRFPMRNRFVSDYIYQKTGKRRTAKQVGSRIQQLRDSCAGRRLLELLHPHPQSARRSTSPLSSQDTSDPILPLRCNTDAWSDASSINSPTTPNELSPTSYDDQPLGVKRAETGLLNVIYIDIIPPDYNVDLATQNEANPSVNWHESYHMSSHTLNVNYVQISQQPRHLRHIDPTIALVSPTAVNADSVFTVRLRDAIIFTEVTQLEYVGPLNSGDSDGPHLYRTTLVPGHWETISNSADPTRYTLEQKVYQDISVASASPLFSAIYKFRFAQKPRTACFSQPCQQITQNLAENPGSGTDQYSHSSHLPVDHSIFDTPSLFESLDQLIIFDEGDDVLTEFESLNVQQSARWADNSPSAQSSSSIHSISGASPPPMPVSPACLSAASSTSVSLTPSPTLFPISNEPCLTLGLQSIQGVPPELYLKPDFFLPDFLDSSGYPMHMTYTLQDQ